MSELIRRATQFAHKAHIAQQRKYTGEPYVFHPLLVAMRVAQWGGDEEMIAAAILHDVVEDCGVGVNELHGLFGARVANLVWWLTDQSKPGDGNRATRKAIDRDHIANAPWDAQTIKCADLIDNALDIVPHDPEFAVTYLREKKLLLSVLNRALDAALIDAHAALAKGETALVQHHLSKKEPANVA